MGRRIIHALVWLIFDLINPPKPSYLITRFYPGLALSQSTINAKVTIRDPFKIRQMIPSGHYPVE